MLLHLEFLVSFLPGTQNYMPFFVLVLFWHFLTGGQFCPFLTGGQFSVFL